MRRMTVWLGCLFLLATVLGMASEDLNPDVEEISLNHAFAPIGFDSNDRVQLVVSGEFSNTCFQVGPHRGSVQGNQILVRQTAYHYSGLCLQVRVPFNQVVELDELLEPGDYEVIDANSGKKLAVLPVKEAPSSGIGPDEFTYAPISEAFVPRTETGAAGEVVLRGAFTNSCMQFEKVRQLPYDDQLVLLPIVSKREPVTNEVCKDGHFPFERREALEAVKAASFLIHIRSMNGQGINKIVSK